MWGRNRLEKEIEQQAAVTITYEDKLIKTGEVFPPEMDRERLSDYKRLRKAFDGETEDIVVRAESILSDTPHSKQLDMLRIAINLADILATKPADMLVGEAPLFESGLIESTEVQDIINGYVEKNNLIQLIHESAIGNSIRGDAWFKVRFGYRQDYSALEELGFPIPDTAEMEPIVEHVAADCVFPETTRGNVKQFKAVNIATVEYVVSNKKETPFLNVERHLPGYIVYERYRLHEGGVDTTYNYPLQTWRVGEQVATGRETDIEETGIPHILVQHVPYKSTDDRWNGISGIKHLYPLLVAINDRITQIDYILWKHSDPNSYGPDLDTQSTNRVRMGGVYIPTTKEDVTPGYMTWDGKLDAAFKELEILIGCVFQLSEIPQWIFGTTLGETNVGGTGTSHTDSTAIKVRFMPILSKVARIRTHYDRTIKDVLYLCQLMDITHGGKTFEPKIPSIEWKDGLPESDAELAEIMSVRTGGKATIDVLSAIKRLDGLDDEGARDIIRRIEGEEELVDASIFNETEAQ